MANKQRKAAEDENQRRRERWWVRPIYDGAQRQLQAAPNSLIREMRLTDPKMFTKWMSPEIFDKLLSIGPLITKKL